MGKETDPIVIDAQSGDKAAFQKLYQTIYRDLYRYALFVLKNRQDAEDAVADTVADAFYSIKKLRDPTAFKSWMFTILSSKIKQKFKEYAHAKKESIEDVFPEIPDQTNPIENIDLFTVLEQLSDIERQIVLLSIIGRYTSAEIGKILSLKAATVRSKLSRSLAKLRDLITEQP